MTESFVCEEKKKMSGRAGVFQGWKDAEAESLYRRLKTGQLQKQKKSHYEITREPNTGPGTEQVSSHIRGKGKGRKRKKNARARLAKRKKNSDNRKKWFFALKGEGLRKNVHSWDSGRELHEEGERCVDG